MKKSYTPGGYARLRNYSLLAGMAVIPGVAGAEVVYNDIPDIIIDDGYQGLDIDGNGMIDFIFEVDYPVFDVSMAMVSGHRHGYGDPANRLMGFQGTSFGNQYFVSALEPTDRVSAGQQWLYAYPDIVSYYYFPMLAFEWGGLGVGGEFVDMLPHIAGVRFLAEDGLHYGWMRLQVQLYPTVITIMDYAYEAEVETPIRAGVTDGCFIPSVVGAAAVTAETARVHWNTVGSANYYIVRYKPDADSVWTLKATDAPKTYRVLRSLECSTPYSWQVKVVCADGSETDYSAPSEFTTLSCRMNENMQTENAPDIFVTGDQVQVQMNNSAAGMATVHVFDLTGRCIEQTQGEGTLTLDAGDWPFGLYIIQITCNGVQYDRKILISR